MRLLQDAADRPFSRIRTTNSVRSSCVGFSLPSHLKDSRYQPSVRSETFLRNFRSFKNRSNINLSFRQVLICQLNLDKLLKESYLESPVLQPACKAGALTS